MYYIGVDVGGTNLVAGLADETGSLLNKASTPVDKRLTAEGLCLAIVRLSREVCRAKGLEYSQIQAVGVGIPGLVDNKRGEVVQTTNMPFDHTPFRALFQKEWDVPVHLGNDANCAAIGEYWAGAAKGASPAVMVTLGTGIGGGLVVDGKLLTGIANSGMEVGHLITHPGGRDCPCGSMGCWEQYGSATALIRMTRQAMEENKSSVLWRLCQGDLDKVQGRTPFQGAEMGDETSKRVLEQYRQELAVGLITLVNVLQPEVICLGGGVSNASDELLLDPLRALVAKGSYDKSMPTKLVRASLGNDAGVVGAAMLCKSV